MAQIAILGAGVMGTALAYPLSDNGHIVHLIGTHLDDDIIASCRTRGIHPRLNRALPPNVHPFPFAELEAAIADVDVVELGVNSRGVRWAAQALGPHLRPGQPVIMVTKGLAASENGDLAIFPDVFQAELPGTIRESVPLAAIGGPSIAGELAARHQTCVIFTGRDSATLDTLAQLYATDYYHIWTSTDMIGVEACVALKNIYALGVGLIPGLLERSGALDEEDAAMHNHAAAFFAQGVVEIAELVQWLGGGLETVFSLPGAGDLYVTSAGGRNQRMGRLLGLGVPPDQAMAAMAGATVEGVEAVTVIAPAVEKLIARGVFAADAFPLMRQVYAVAVQGQPYRPLFEHFFQLPSMKAQHAAHLGQPTLADRDTSG